MKKKIFLRTPEAMRTPSGQVYINVCTGGRSYILALMKPMFRSPKVAIMRARCACGRCKAVTSSLALGPIACAELIEPKDCKELYDAMVGYAKERGELESFIAQRRGAVVASVIREHTDDDDENDQSRIVELAWCETKREALELQRSRYGNKTE